MKWKKSDYMSMLCYFWLSTGLLLLQATCCTHGNQNGCSFPEFLQTKMDRWLFNLTRAGVISDDTETHYITVENGLMKTFVQGGDEGRFNRTCFEAKGNNKFVLIEIRENDKENTRFICMKFIRHSKNVVDMEVSEYASTPLQDLCDRLQLEERPLVRYSADTSEMCPFVGGFDMKVYTPEGELLCHELYREARLESRCMQDKFLQFDFASCNIKNVIESRKDLHHLDCAGSWQSGENTFVILSRPQLIGFWCLRYPTNHDDEFDTYLFSDVVCERSDVLHKSTIYARLHLKRNIYNSLCKDFSEDCETEERDSTCDRSFDNNLGVTYCKKKCSFCAEDDDTNCEFTPETLGTWIPIDEQPFDNITLSNTASLLPLGKMSCQNSRKFLYENKLISYSSDGCYPRYYCFFAQGLSPTVMVYKMLPGPKWPVYWNFIPCSDNEFDDENRDFEFFVNKWSPTMSQNPPEAVACKIPEVAYVFDALFENGVKCSGRLYKPDCLGEKAKRITLNYQKCSNESYETTVNLTCHAHMPSPDEKYQLVSDEATGSFYCLSLLHSQLTIMPANECNSDGYYLHRIVRLTTEAEDDNHCTAKNDEEEHPQVEVSTGGKDDIPTTIKSTDGALPQKTSQTFCGIMVFLLLIQIFIFSE